MSETIVNLTPHPVQLLDGSNCSFDPKCRSYRVEGDVVVVKTFAPGDVIPRCSQKEQLIGNVDGVDIFRMEFGEVENLPDQQDGVYYIVSAMVAQARPDRHDLLIPAHLVRNEDGRILGCLAFSQI